MEGTPPVAAAPSPEELDRAFAALADPTRRALVERLSRGEAGVLELAAPFAMSQPAVSKHLKVLEAAGLISRRRLAQRNLCRLEPVRLKHVSDWVGSYRRYWEASFDRLDAYIETMRDETRPDGTPPDKTAPGETLPDERVRGGRQDREEESS
ncbi:MAG TPA: metalloregulator ArsR/SmtB family transcription factor [Actinocrinis sp.]|nr:metalloregulator ArsR/SmtB family transcription factor [Actinocrinis sp.]